MKNKSFAAKLWPTYKVSLFLVYFDNVAKNMVLFLMFYFSEFSLQNILHYFCYVLRAFNTEKDPKIWGIKLPSFQDHEIFLIRIIKKGLKQANANIKDYSGYNSYENLCRISPVFGFGFMSFLWREGGILNEGLKMHQGWGLL